MGWGGYMPAYTEFKPETPKLYPDVLIKSEDVPPLLRLLEDMPKGSLMAIDTETTGLFPHEDDVIRGVSIAFTRDGEKIHSFYIPVNYPNPEDNLRVQDQQSIFQAINDLEPFLILHHGKFDFAFLRQLPSRKDGGVFFPFPEPHRWWDTKVVAWLLDENMSTGLKEQAAFHFGEDQKAEQKEVKRLLKLRGGWDKLTPEDTAAYGAKDAELTLRLYQLQAYLVAGVPPILGDVRPAIERELAIQATLHRMEATGILVDEGYLDELTVTTQAQVIDIETSFLPLNINSPLQLAQYLYDHLGIIPPEGSRSTARAVLEGLRVSNKADQEKVDTILKHRRLKKAMTGYLVPLKARIGRDGRIHAGFSSTGTVTGRFSCSNPNLQTIPRGDTLIGVRDVFVAEDGFELWEYDLAGAELRVLAAMSGEELLTGQLLEGRDMHSENATNIFGENFTPLQRRAAKNIMYGWAYGLSSLDTAARYIVSKDVTLAQAKTIAGKVLKGIKKLYPAMFRLMNRMTAVGEKDGYVPISPDGYWPGRFRRFVSPSPRRSPAYTALNAQVQGGIGEFMKDVMLLVEFQLDAVGARLCLQVHDSLVIEVPEGMGPAVLEILNKAAAELNPFAMAMEFTGNPWGAHD